jgi:glutamate-1-semialdehyde 2,1-aminomutase
LVRAIAARGAKACVQRVGSMITLFFTGGPVRSWDDAKASDTKHFARWHRGLLERGIYWPPSQFEAAFLGTAHTHADVDATVQAAQAAL